MMLLVATSQTAQSDCNQYLSESKRYSREANRQTSRELYNRYLSISKKYYIQYKDCIHYQQQQQRYQGYRSYKPRR